ncbi:hypothetical protein [Streptomyces aurantiogriseus]|uniref:Lipoprotein n=1 Tax=Streptomyces aurantiogriseus TaxID=66870 RepID=A0A918FL05_9ACTN|nr:hypothetical protein [Streptomyces aurantiogriseus]GGR49102.1 hypothetical protein GCM10010251_77710 [Streptomyces aurantiogriseus]
MTGNRAALASALAALVVTAGCTRQAPNPPDFGYARGPEGGVLIAYPLCPGAEVSGAEVQVLLDDGFKKLWSARGPRSPDVRGGLFEVGNGAGFTQEERRLSGKLPDGFYVGVSESVGGRETDGRDGWIDLSRLEGARLGEGEYMTHTGKVLTRAAVNAQRRCS